MSRFLTIKIINIDSIDLNNTGLFKHFMPKKYNNSLCIKDEISKKQSLATIILMSKNLDFHEDELYYNEYKKPLLKNIYFNLSHSSKYVAFIKDIYPIGIDIQEIKTMTSSFKKFSFTEKELNYIADDSTDKLYEIWTKKESLLKAFGTGFTTRPCDMNIDLINTENGVFFKNSFFYFKTLRFENYYVSVCSTRTFDGLNLIHENC